MLREIKKKEILEPRTLILYSLPKTGKTSALSQLPDNLIIDFDDGAKYYENMRVNIDGTNEEEYYNAFLNIYKQIKEEVEKNGKFRFITIDTITAMYDKIANIIAVKNYNKEENKDKPLSFDITKLSYGQGYIYKREAMNNIINEFQKLCNCLILTGHVGDKSINKETKSLEVTDIDIEGKLKNIISYKVDAIGLFYREEQNKCFIRFSHENTITAGTRIEYLNEKTILVSELKDNKLITYWENIFPSLSEK